MSNNSHLKTELSRHKRKLKDAQCEIIKVCIVDGDISGDVIDGDIADGEMLS